MNNRKVSIIIGIFIAILAVTAILVCFAPAFGADYQSYGDTRGNVFQIMFGYQNKVAIPVLIVAFILQIVAAVFALIAAIIPGRIGGINFGIAALLLIVAGILFLLAPQFYQSANAGTIAPIEGQTITNGTGTLLTGIFSIVGGVVGLYAGYRAFKA